MSNIITVKEALLTEALKVEATIPEFDETYPQNYEKELNGRTNLITVAYVDDKAAGYMIGYDRFKDNSFYCWMTGVSPEFRKMGILKKMMYFFTDWCKNQGYKKIKIKTRNSRREMFAYLVKYGFNAIDIQNKEDIIDNRILFEREI